MVSWRQARSLLLLTLYLPTGTILAAEYTPSLTEHGHPNLQGNWSSATITPLQRPEDLGTQKTYDSDEADALSAERLDELAARAAPIENTEALPEVAEFISNSAEEAFMDDHKNHLIINGEVRTSILIEPENGRLPFKALEERNNFASQWRAAGFTDFDGPEMAGAGPRCLIDFGALPPAGPVVPISPHFKIIQNSDYIAIYIEAGSELRIIRLSEEPKPQIGGRWHGDSLGRWEGNSLVVQTDNFHPQSTDFALPMSAALEITERFTPISATEILYQFNAHDPNVYSEDFAGELILNRMPPEEKLYSYECHEGNYSLPGMLAGARRLDVYGEPD